MKFVNKLRQSIGTAESCLCVGLDPYIDRLPLQLDKYKSDIHKVSVFLKKVIDLTAPYCAAYKPNLAFFEALGPEGIEILDEIVNFIPDNKITIADAKRGDISTSSAYYCKNFFERVGFDAVTMNPLMGFETLDPFSGFPDKSIYVLTLTSNPGASDFFTKPFSNHRSMSEFIASSLKNYQDEAETHIGMVVGATQTRLFKKVIQHHPKASLLIPGIGKQGGRFDQLIDLLSNHEGIPVVTSSRTILFPGQRDSKQWEKEIERQVISYKEQLVPISEKYV